MGKELVPITREVLKDFYSSYPMEPVPEDLLNKHVASVQKVSAEVGLQGSKVPETFGMETPTRIDDCFWKNRLLCEEMAHSLGQIASGPNSNDESSALSASSSDSFLETERAIDAVQKSNTEAAGAQIRQFLPKDFRGSILEMKRNSTERHYAKQVDDLRKKGGSIRDRYDLYLRQQWERRESLSQMGELSGMFKFLVKYMGGIPQVLLDFAKEINAKLGPMEEQRIKYGPDLYSATSLGIKVNVALALLLENLGALESRQVTAALTALKPAMDFYMLHVRRVIEFLGALFSKSPFFVSANEVMEVKERSSASSATGVIQKPPSWEQLPIVVEDAARNGSVLPGALSAAVPLTRNHSRGRSHAHTHELGRHSLLSDTFLSCVDHHSWVDASDYLGGAARSQHSQDLIHGGSNKSIDLHAEAGDIGSPDDKQDDSSTMDARRGHDAAMAPPIVRGEPPRRATQSCFNCFAGGRS